MALVFSEILNSDFFAFIYFCFIEGYDPALRFIDAPGRSCKR